MAGFRWIALAIILSDGIQSQNICDFEDIDCMTRGSDFVYKNVFNGIEGLIEPLEPMHLDVINGKLEDLRYKLTNATYTGFKKCDVKSLTIVSKEETFDLVIRCPKLILNAYIETNGSFNSILIVTGATFTMTSDNYIIKIKGTYGKHISESNMFHVFIETYKVFTEPIGKVTYEIDNDEVGDINKAATTVKYMNQNWREVEKQLTNPIIGNFIGLFIENYNIILKTYSLESLIPQGKHIPLIYPIN